MKLSRTAKWRIGVGSIALAVVIVGVSILYAVGHNAHDLRQVVDDLADLEHRNVKSLRAAAFRICARANLDRAEWQVAYGTLLTDRKVQKLVLARVRHNLPIVNCKPNLRGGAAVPLSLERQAAYVARYAQGRLDPTPGDNRKPVQRSSLERDLAQLSPEAQHRALELAVPVPKKVPRSDGGGSQKPRDGPDNQNPQPESPSPSEPPGGGPNKPSTPKPPSTSPEPSPTVPEVPNPPGPPKVPPAPSPDLPKVVCGLLPLLCPS